MPAEANDIIRYRAVLARAFVCIYSLPQLRIAMATLASWMRPLRRSHRPLRSFPWIQAPVVWTRQLPQDGLRLDNRSSSSARSIPASDSEGSDKTAGLAPIPFKDVTYARSVPATASYFSREPQFNDLYIRLSNLLAKYRHLPKTSPSDAPQFPWVKLEEMRAQLGEPIKASHFSRVVRVARRLNLVESSIRPSEVKEALQAFAREVDPFLNQPRPITIDKFGRAVGVGKRKESTARAFVVEGIGEILVNGKTLSEAFGRVHDRESAVWALTATERLDKYNVWALVEGGGTTGQAEALTLAVAKALLAHEPALKPALRKGKLPCSFFPFPLTSLQKPFLFFLSLAFFLFGAGMAAVSVYSCVC